MSISYSDTGVLDDGVAISFSAGARNPSVGVGVEYRFSPALVTGAIRIVDALAFMLAALAATAVHPNPADSTLHAGVVQAGFAIILYGMLAGGAGFYKLGCVMRPLTRLDGVILTVVATVVAFAAAAFAFDALDVHPPAVIAVFGALSLVFVTAGRFVARTAAVALSRSGVVGSNMVVLGTGASARRFLARFDTARPYLSSIAGVFDLDNDPIGMRSFEGRPMLGGLDELMRLARQHKIDDVVVAMPANLSPRLAETIESLKELPINVHLSTELDGYDLSLDPSPGDFASCPMLAVMRRPISGPSSVLKAGKDYVLAGAALLLLFPLFALIAIAIKIDSPGPVFFMQKRLGFNNREFEIFKFRSMHHNRPPDPADFTPQATRNDPRVTRVGRLLRATSLDELPQLLNVLNGTMSLVGPRPHAMSHNKEYGRVIRGYFARHRVKPGITGWAQVNGLRGETEDIRLMEARVRHDIYYADNWSLMFDVKILVLTVMVVLFQKTAY